MTTHIIGGFSSVTFYYLPLKKRLENLNVPCSIINPGPFGLNIWPLRQFEECIFPIIESSDDIYLIGHSLGGIQAMWLAFNFPNKIKKVFTLCSPVHGSPVKMYEGVILKILDVPQLRWEAFQIEGLQAISSKIVTISSPQDLIAPTESCIIKGAKNYKVCTEDIQFSPSPHIVIPFLAATADLIAGEIFS